MSPEHPNRPTNENTPHPEEIIPFTHSQYATGKRIEHLVGDYRPEAVAARFAALDPDLLEVLDQHLNTDGWSVAQLQNPENVDLGEPRLRALSRVAGDLRGLVTGPVIQEAATHIARLLSDEDTGEEKPAIARPLSDENTSKEGPANDEIGEDRRAA